MNQHRNGTKRILPAIARVIRATAAAVAGTLAALVLADAVAAPPPSLVNYQGVLRNSAEEPLSGAYDMEFRFWDAAVAGAEIMIDRHTAAGGNGVTVAGGLFDVALGGGSVDDGAGPGTYTSLDAVFRDHSEVWLEVRVAGETLTPRTRMLSAPYALNATTATAAGDATQLAGQPAGFYLDTSATPQTKLGPVLFNNAAGTGRGIEAWAPDAGGYFRDSDQSGYAFAGAGDTGLQGYGTAGGGFFQDLDSTSVAYLAYGHYGVQGYGNSSGGYFADNDGTGYAYVAYQDYGIRAFGGAMGGYFADSNSTGFTYAGVGDIGLQAYGSYAGAYFDSTVASAYAYLGYGDIGIEGYGNGAGGFFRDRDAAGYGYVGYSAYKIYGNGAVSFVQNHPTQKDRVIVYAAPEGDEAAVYTRGSGRLSAGRADVALGETFALVANPDIGLTAHLTSRGVACLVYARDISTERLSVAADDPRCADAAFDYIVYGLRIGFETLPILQVKHEEAYLPTAQTLAELEGGQADTVASSALVRFTRSGGQEAAAPADRTRAAALAAQINAGREQWLSAAAADGHGRERALLDADRAPLAEPSARRDPPAHDPVPSGAPGPQAPHVAGGRRVASASASASVAEGRADEPSRVAAVAEPRPGGATWMAVVEPVHAGDLLVLDESTPGALRRSSAPSGSTIVGVAAGASRPSERGSLEALVITAGIVVEVFADASQAGIRPGDPLVTSPLPGHVMRPVGGAPAAVLGLAIDALDAGTGSIRVLLGAR